MAGLAFWDCNLMLGQPSTPIEYRPWRREDILAVMRRCGIRRAMVSGVEALEYHPTAGNASLDALCSADDGLFPVWTLLPGHTGEFPRGAALAEALDRNGIGMARLWPAAGHHNFSLARWCSGEMLDVLAQKRVPVLLDASEVSFDTFHTLLQEHPSLRLILTNMTYRMDRMVYPLLEQHENLFLETSGLKGFQSIEDLCRRFGSGRLLFGTGLPAGSAGAAVGVIEYAAISQEEKRQIAYENLETLLNTVR